MELDGPDTEVQSLMRDVQSLCKKSGSWEIRVAQSEQERALVWKGRKAAFAAMGRIRPTISCQVESLHGLRYRNCSGK